MSLNMKNLVYLCFLCVSAVLGETVPEITPSKSVTTHSLPPQVFPAESSKLPIIKNETILHILQENTDKTKIPPNVFPNDTTKYKIIVNNDTILHTLQENTDKSKIPPKIFPNDTSVYKILKNNSTLIKKLINNNNKTNSEENVTVPRVFPKDNSTFKIIPSNETIIDKLTKNSITTEPLPPATFPTSSKQYKVIPTNDSIIHKLVHNDTEVEDMMSSKQYKGEYDVDQIKDEFKTSTTSTTVKPITIKIVNEGIRNNMDVHANHAHAMSGRTSSAAGQVTGVLISLFVMVAIIAYVALVLWRRTLEYRYGNRELLINVDDFERNDHRFEL